jgi:hypothetical protein
MDIYIGKHFIEKAIEAQNQSATAFSWQGKDILIVSKEPLLFNITLGGGKVLFLWGHVHAVCLSGKEYTKVEKEQGGGQILEELFKKFELRDAIGRIEGHYIGSLASAEQDIVLFGDTFNRRELFYSRQGNGLIASTELEPIINQIKPTGYDQNSLACLLSIYGNYAPKRDTIYKGISRLGIGEMIEYKNGTMQVDSRPFEGIPTGDYGEPELEEYSNLLHSAVDIRSSSKLNWVYLSSGWDSSAILSVLTKLHGAHKVRGVIARFKYSNESGVSNQFEINRAMEIAKYFSVPVDVVEVDYTRGDYLGNWEEIRCPLKANHMYAMNAYNFLQLAKHVSKNGGPSDSIFNGEISDGAHNLGFSQFATILEHPDLQFREYSDKMASYLYGPSFFSRVVEGSDPNQDAIYSLLRSRAQGASFNDPIAMDKQTRKSQFIESFFLQGLRIPFLKPSGISLLTANGKESFESDVSGKYLKACIENLKPETLYSWILHLYNSFHWQGGSVRAVTSSASQYGMQSSMPYWDSRVQRFLSAMPESWGRGLDMNPTKYPLKWMLKNKVDYPMHLQTGPHSYLYDTDPNWSADADILYGSSGKAHFQKEVGKYQYENILDPNYFDLTYMKKIVDNYSNGVEVRGAELSDLKNLVSLCNVGWY